MSVDPMIAAQGSVDPGDPSTIADDGVDRESRAPWHTILLLVVASFGSGIALIVPMVFSMAVRLTELAPDSEQVLGFILGAGAVCSLVAAPLTGIVSDRTRTRWGRRKPFAVLGIVIGLAAVPVFAFGPNLVVLGLGWMLTSVAWGTTGASIGNLLADRLPERQRGQVSGLVNLAGQVSPVLGILVAGQFADDSVLLFLIPAAIGAALVGMFVVFVHEPDSRDMQLGEPLTVARFIRSLAFHPRQHPRFAWVLSGRFFFFFGLSLTVAYGTYFYAQRLGVSVTEVSTVMAAISALGIVSASLGALGAGWLSDRVGTRRGWVAASAIVFAAGSAVSAFAWTFPMLIVGALVTNLGIAAFGSAGQALVLDVLPYRSTQAGRFLAIASFSQRIPSAVAPLVAPLLLGLAASRESQYVVLYLASAALALVGGAVPLFLGRRPR
ncbi:MFS transporter [Plantibacter flavus]|uniref:MFS transporter n=1 Tax=Plantibacter flavus TaxID=150123 RepID=UPI003F144E69